MYIATTYIGSAYTPGEVLPDDFPAEKLEWLIRAGAVREAAPAPAIAEPLRDIASEDDAHEEWPDASEEDEFDEDAEAPEFDVMAGIVKDTPTPEEKAAPKPRATGRKAPKGGKAK